MKLILVLAVLGFAAASNAAVKTQDKTITKVVKLLQQMLEKSVKEGDEETKIYAKFKCYCDQSEAEKTASIADSTKQISILEAKIEELQGSNGEESSKSAKLKADMAANEAARKEADSIRGKQNKAFIAEESDLKQAIGQMEDAISTLTAVGADQTMSTGADNKQFMAGKSASSLLSLGSTMKSALTAAEAFMSTKDYNSFNSFIQAPFTGTYTSQSGAVMGIIKSMKDTFKTNLATAISTEATDLKSYNDFTKIKTDAFNEMSDLYDGSQSTLGGNDQDLGSKRGQLSEAEKSKADDEEFMDKLVPMCKAKGKDYDERKLMRANEEAAVAQAISILNSDEAFATFGGVSATGKEASVNFVQISRHTNPSADDVRAVMQRLLQRAAKEAGHSTRLAPVISQLQAENPFDSVLDEIEKMVSVIAEEGKADKEKLDWCKKERKENKKSIKDKKAEILRLNTEADSLTKSIEDVVTGLKHNIAETEASLLQNKESQTTETKDRAEENVAYQADVKNLVAAEALVDNAIKVLKAYYDTIDAQFLQSMEDPTPPKSWKNDSYKGQSSKGGDAIGMLKFILDETRTEETEAHSSEEKSQAEYEDSMTELKRLQGKKESSISKLQETLATKEADLLEAKENRKDTTVSRDKDETYLETIKPGCDFITSNFDLRVANRKTETTGLNKAMSTLKGSPAYKNAVVDATEEGYGKCKAPCVKDSLDVKCLACQADVTIPAYCAGHKGTSGC